MPYISYLKTVHTFLNPLTQRRLKGFSLNALKEPVLRPGPEGSPTSQPAGQPASRPVSQSASQPASLATIANPNLQR